MVSAITALASSFGSQFSGLADLFGAPALGGLAAIVIICAAIWIIRERQIKSIEEGV